MNSNYIHSKKNNINLLYLLCAFSLIMYGFYKNGYLVYKELGNKIVLFKPLLIPLIAISIPCIIGYIKERKLRLNDNIIYMLLLSLCVPIGTSIIVFLVSTIIFSLLLYFVLDKLKTNMNYVCLFKLLLVVVLCALHKYVYPNDLEIVSRYSYNLRDIFFGRGISGINNSSILLIIISYFILCSNYYYKKELPLYSLAIYFLLAIIYKVAFNNVIIFNSMIIYSFVFLESISLFSPAEKKEQIIYSVLVGILSFFLTYYVNRYDGVIIAIAISSLINYINLK